MHALHVYVPKQYCVYSHNNNYNTVMLHNNTINTTKQLHVIMSDYVYYVHKSTKLMTVKTVYIEQWI